MCRMFFLIVHAWYPFSDDFLMCSWLFISHVASWWGNGFQGFSIWSSQSLWDICPKTCHMFFPQTRCTHVIPHHVASRVSSGSSSDMSPWNCGAVGAWGWRYPQNVQLLDIQRNSDDLDSILSWFPSSRLASPNLVNWHHGFLLFHIVSLFQVVPNFGQYLTALPTSNKCFPSVAFGAAGSSGKVTVSRATVPFWAFWGR